MENLLGGRQESLVRRITIVFSLLNGDLTKEVPFLVSDPGLPAQFSQKKTI